MIAIAPSILAADFARLGEQVRETERAGADRVHVDVMDGHFVPNLSMGAAVVKGLRPVTRLPLEVHLMVEDPGRFLDGFVKAGADTLIFHLEVEPEPERLVRHIRSLGKKVGLAFNPDMPVERIEPYLRDIDLALCMTVFPGFGGQAFIPESLGRVKAVRDMIRAINPTCDLEVDGGIDATTLPPVVTAGANVLVAGTAVFGTKDGPSAATKHLAKLGADAPKAWLS
jgi:ribulose-phosphate 3-epimerase